MIRGCQRKMVKLCGCADTIFEEAYFVIKPGCDLGKMNERDIIIEANRIIDENTTCGGRKHVRRVSISVFTFVCLILFGSLGLTSLIITLSLL